MGFAVAREAMRRGHGVVLVLGPVDGTPPEGAEVERVESAKEMLEAALRRLPECGAAICAAAVADFRPAQESPVKLERGAARSLALVENPDVAAEIGARREGRPLAVFALESGGGVARALGKLFAKRADLCVLNGPEAIGAARARFAIVRRDGSVRDLGEATKDDVARVLLDELAL
jgi:phosphopantothenoylcysteine decarboxylase/phosphopantothenate--cysteine ligase